MYIFCVLFYFFDIIEAKSLFSSLFKYSKLEYLAVFPIFPIFKSSKLCKL